MSILFIFKAYAIATLDHLHLGYGVVVVKTIKFREFRRETII